MDGWGKKDGGLTMPSMGEGHPQPPGDGHSGINRGYDGCPLPPGHRLECIIHPVLGRGCQTEATLSSQKQ